MLADTVGQLAFNTVLKTVPTRTVVEQILTYRRNHGPQQFRNVVQESLERSVDADSPDAQAKIMEDAVEDVRALCERYRSQPWLEAILSASVAGAAALGAYKLSRREAMKVAFTAFAAEATTGLYKPLIAPALDDKILDGTDESARELVKLLPWWFSAAQPIETIPTEVAVQALSF
jgi:hypothetical protein